MDDSLERRPLLYRNMARSSDSVSSSSKSSITSSSFVAGRNACKTRTASTAILLSVAFERMAFYALGSNLVLFLNEKPFQWTSYHAIGTSLYFFGLSFITSLVGGWVADSFFGRFKTLVLSFGIYMAGYAFMPVLTYYDNSSEAPKMPQICYLVNGQDDSANGTDTSNTGANRNPFHARCAWLIYISLTLIAIGTGFVKANIAPFGSDQVMAEGQRTHLSFFNWFYWAVNLGAFVSLGGITYVQQQDNFFYGYVAAAACLGLAALCFIVGRVWYACRAPDGSVLANIFCIIREACHRKRRKQPEYRTMRERAHVVDDAEPIQEELTFLDYAKHRYGGIFHDTLVDDVKQLKKIVCTFAVLVPYWLVYFQMETTFLIQGLHMRLTFTRSNYVNCDNATTSVTINDDSHQKIVAAWLSLFDVVVLIILLPLFDRIIYPWIEKRRGALGITVRICIGMFLAIIAMCTAGLVEHFRLQRFWPCDGKPDFNVTINQMIGNTTYHAADMNVFWQIPQYTLIGISEVFTSVAGLQFAVSVAPNSMKGIIMGLFYFFSGVGSFLGTAIVSVLSATQTWFVSNDGDYGDINCRVPGSNGTVYCHLDYFFFLLAGIELVGIVLFVIVANKFHLDDHLRLSLLNQNADHAGSLGNKVQRPSRNVPNSIQKPLLRDSR